MGVLFQDRLNQPRETDFFRQVSPVLAQVNARENHLPVARLAKSADMVQNVLKRQAAAAPPHVRDDAKEAAIIAAVLNLQVGTSSRSGRPEERSSQKLFLGEDVIGEDPGSGRSFCWGGRSQASGIIILF